MRDSIEDETWSHGHDDQWAEGGVTGKVEKGKSLLNEGEGEEPRGPDMTVEVESFQSIALLLV